MAALTSDRTDNFKGRILAQHRIPVAAATTIYLGAMVSADASGYALGAADTAAQASKAIGIALEYSDNSAGANGDETVMVMFAGEAEFPIGSLVQADLLKTVHASDDQTLALTSTNSREVGKLIGLSSTRAFVSLA